MGEDSTPVPQGPQGGQEANGGRAWGVEEACAALSGNVYLCPYAPSSPGGYLGVSAGFIPSVKYEVGHFPTCHPHGASFAVQRDGLCYVFDKSATWDPGEGPYTTWCAKTYQAQHSWQETRFLVLGRLPRLSLVF